MDDPSDPVERSRSRRRALEWGAVCIALVVVAGLAVGGWALSRGGSSSTSATSLPAVPPAVPAGATSGPPSVLTKDFVGLPLAEHYRDVLVGVGARPRGPLDVVVIPSDESVVAPQDVQLVRGATTTNGASATSCGERCLRFPLHVLSGAPSSFAVTVDRRGKPAATVHFSLPARLPRLADRLYRSARSRMLALESLGMHETLGSGLAATVVSTWSFHAPDRMSYEIAGGPKAVVIGTRRWDWADGAWSRSTTTRLGLPAYPWQSVTGARLLGAARFDGRPVRVLAALKPGGDFPTWFLLYVAPDGHVMRMRMSTTGHFMVDTYGAFDSAPAIRPPA